VWCNEHIKDLGTNVYTNQNLVLFQQQSSREGLSDEDVQSGGIVGVEYTWSTSSLHRDIMEA